MRTIKKVVTLIVGLQLSLTASSVMANQWQIIGPRALGMGGAHVAVVNDASAQYWNPAAFGFFGRETDGDSNAEQKEGEEEKTILVIGKEVKKQKKKKKDEHSDKDFGMYIHGGIGYQAHEGIIAEIEDVQIYDFDTLKAEISGGTLSSANVDDYVRLVAELGDLNKENIAVTVLANAGLHLRLKNFGVGALGAGEIAASPILDLVNINPSGSGSMVTELAAMTGSGDVTPDVFSASEMSDLITRIDALPGWNTADSTGYVQAVDEGLDASSVPSATQQIIDDVYDTALLASQTAGGGSFDNNSSLVNYRGALVFEVPITYGHAFNDNLALGVNLKFMKARTYFTNELIYDSDTESFFDEAKDHYMESSDFGVDLGVLYKKGIFRAGLVGRNLNTPTFDWAGPGDYELDPQVRAGVALRLWNWITVAADIDVTENDTNVSPNYKSKVLGGGLELDLLKFLRLRGGAYKNLSEDDIGIVYTAGLGVNFYLFQLDLGASMSKEKTRYDGDEVPEEVRGELALSFQF